jgi:uncharacterized protein YciI
MYQLLFYDVVEDYLERRVPLRDAHLGLVHAAEERGELLMAGAFGDPVEGALLLFRAADASTAEAFARADPYVSAGLVLDWRVRAWHEVLTHD